MTPGDTTVEFSRRCRHCGSALSATSSFCSKCGATAVLPDAAADTLREKVAALFGADIDLERELGRGGMAVVFAGFDPALQRRVAIKVLLPEIANDRSMADRFLREARTVASLQHPHVVTVYSVRSVDGVHAIVMQFVEGRSLDAVLQERTTMPVHVAGMLLAQSAEGLQHAHDRGVIHRDVKPANVLIDRDGRAIVSDFGIARRDDGPRTTETGLVVGTWAYMSPEQRSADSVTAATDQYALGVMAFELLTGRLPFTGTPSEMLRAHLYEPPPSLRALRPDVSEVVEATVHRMLAKQPADRFPSLKEPERIFRALVPDEGKTTLQLAAYSHVRARAGSQVIAAATRSVPASVRSAPTERTDGRVPGAGPAQPADVSAPSRRKAPPVLIGAGAGIVVLVVAFVLLQGRGSGSSGAAPSPPMTQTTQTNPAPTNAGGAATSQPPSPAGPENRTPTADGARPAAGSADRLPVSPPSGATLIAPAPLNAPTTPPRADSSPRAAPAVSAPAQPGDAGTAASRTDSPRPEMPSAALADARRIGREFVTLLNQRRHRELAAVPKVGGDDAARAELIRLTETAPEFAAGFDRVASAPSAWTRGFETELYVDLEWRGGRKVMRVRLYAEPSDGGWRLAGMAIDPAN